jgi:dihydroorotate dehydrogenase electron transfer subunit
MPVDVAAEVIASTPLSDDYSVLALAAPSIAAAAQPGQFVMVKPAASHDPLLRRPFSVFEVLRDAAGTPTGISLLNKRAGVSTSQIYAARPGQRLACLGPLGRPWPLIEPSQTAAMVAGGVGLAPFATLAEALVSRGVACTLFYGARSHGELFYVDFFRRLGVEVVLATEDGSAGEHGRVTTPLERRLRDQPGRPLVYTCGPEPMMAAVARLAARFQVACFASMERIMGCGLGGCYSCVVPVREAGDAAGFRFVKSCIAGPVMAAGEILWDQA